MVRVSPSLLEADSEGSWTSCRSLRLTCRTHRRDRSLYSLLLSSALLSAIWLLCSWNGGATGMPFLFVIAYWGSSSGSRLWQSYLRTNVRRGLDVFWTSFGGRCLTILIDYLWWVWISSASCSACVEVPILGVHRGCGRLLARWSCELTWDSRISPRSWTLCMQVIRCSPSQAWWSTPW